ncbi:MAG: hypothetical protein NXY57DRAFT_1038738 [Lentinula lateritia]|nr:MAG: hypothetical protein NXY57DRAFT_1038738 [Lentinula lateritia]
MQNTKQTRTVLNPNQLQILSATLNKAIYQTNEGIAQLVKDTGLTSAQVKTWFDNRRRVLRQNEFERQRIAAERQHGDTFYDPIYVESEPAADKNSYKTPTGFTCHPTSSFEYNTDNPSLPSISSMFPEIFNSEYDYTLPPNVRPIELPSKY